MSKKKGLSLEEKKQRMLQLFYEKQDFFQLKELEKIAPKEKGIVAQSVKDVVQMLVDDNQVESEKIGTSIYFWAFPSKGINIKKRKIDSLNEKQLECCKRIKKAESSVEILQKGREDNEERNLILNQLTKLKNEEDNLKKQIQKYKDSDPEVIEKLKSDIKISKEAINRWTDNIYAIRTWCRNKFAIEESEINKQFGIDSELDYINT